jgi:hypothetical protein
LPFKTLTGIFEQCFGGGFIQDLRGKGRVLMSAATEFQLSWGERPVGYDTFSYYFTEALTGAGDENGDNKVSMLEAFIYAKRKDTQPEEPQLEDSGDGISVTNPSGISGDGLIAKSRFL